MIANRVNLKLVHTFILVAESGSFRRAAQESQRSPSAISMQIRDLEEQVGLSLFNRTPQKAQLTAEGMVLFEQVRQAMADVQAGLERLSDVAAQRARVVRIACVPTLAATRLVNILTIFKLRHPYSVVEVKEISTMNAAGLLRDQEVELHIGPETPDLADFQFEPVFEDRLVACIPPALDDGTPSMTLRALSNFPIIALDQQTAIRDLMGRLCDDQGLKLNIQYEVQQAYTAIALAAAGLGVAIVPQIAIPMVLATNFRVVPISDLGTSRLVGILTARGHVLHGYSRLLIDLIRSELG